MELILTRIAKKKGYTIGRLQTLSDSTDPSRPPLKGEERKSPFKGDLEGLYTLSGKRIAHEQKGCVTVQKGRKFVTR